MISALGSSVLRTIPLVGQALGRHATVVPQARGLFSMASPLSARRAPLARLLMSGADRTVVGKATDLITEALSPTDVKIEGAYDDPNGSHITVYVVSEEFEGKRSLARQQLVNKALWDLLAGNNAPVHAIDTMVLKAPSEVS